jgi:2-methylfumaryl-CoA isomerase
VYGNIVGNPDESTAVDYTVNASSGIALATGPVGSLLPVNHALPAWDIATGLHAAIGILVAERHRRATGEGQLVKVSLADVAFTMVANLGFLAQAQLTHENRPPLGNDMYGAFGRDFATRDGRRVMVVAISLNQWQTLVRATGVEEHLPAIAKAFAADFTKEEDRYRARDAIAALMKPWFESRTLDEVRVALDEHGVCWGPYQTFTQLLDDDWRASEANPVFGTVDHPGIGPLLTPASPLRFPEAPPTPPPAAPLLGLHTDEVLEEVLGLSPMEIARLHDDGLVATAGARTA